MALRKVLLEGDSTLRKKSRQVTDFGPRTKELIKDMFETMRHEDGIGLAAPQLAVLKRVFVMENLDDSEPTVFINPIILEQDGEQTAAEGCLSLPGLFGVVSRPEKIRVKAQDENGDFFERTYSGLAARCICHETDHLDGILYRDKALDGLYRLDESDDDEKSAADQITTGKAAK